MAILGVILGAWFFGAIFWILWALFVCWVENIPLTDKNENN